MKDVITVEYMWELYNNGQAHDCLNSVNWHLLFNKCDPQALYLKALCELELAEATRETGKAYEILQAARKSFETILIHHPDQVNDLWHITYVNICNRLAETDLDEKSRMKAIEHRLEAYYMAGNGEKALADLEEIIAFKKQHYRNNRSELDTLLSKDYLFKADILRHLVKDVPAALNAYKESYNYAHQNCLLHCSIANFAFDNRDYELGGQAFYKAFFHADDDYKEILLALYYRAEALITAGIENKDMIAGIFHALLTIGDCISCEDIIAELKQRAQHYMILYPDWDIPYYYVGTAFYLAANYQVALPYLKKSIYTGGYAFGLVRTIESEYYATGLLYTEDIWPDDSATEYFEAGVDFYFNFEMKVRTAENEIALKHLRKAFFEKAYNVFYNYFFNAEGVSETNDALLFARCCNNYGMVLSELGEYEKAVKVHELGYRISPFWEQLYSWSHALVQMGKEQEALVVLSTAVSYPRTQLNFTHYLELKEEKLELLCKIGKIDTAKQRLEALETEWNEYLEASKTQKATNNDSSELDVCSIKIQHIRQMLASEKI